MKLIPVAIVVAVLFIAMAGTTAFIGRQIKPISEELAEQKAVLTQRVTELRDTEDRLAEAQEKIAELESKLKAAEAEINTLKENAEPIK